MRLIALLFFLMTASAAAADRYNIVLIISDDHGLDAIGAYGNDVVRTPHLDRLAAEGVRFTNAHATVSSCSPSRSVLLTGLHNHSNGMYGLEHWEHNFSSLQSVVSLPVRLSEMGYRTARIGKYHLSPETVYRFDEVLSAGAANDMASLARSPVEMADKVSAFVSQQNAAPFFLYFATDDPHRGFPFDTYPEPNRFGNQDGGYPGSPASSFDPADVIVPDFLPDTPETRQEIAEYYASVERVDRGVGALMDLLGNAGLMDNTIIVYLSDNGVAFPGAKTTLYQPGINLPLIVRAPIMHARGGVSDALISWTDITPTILDFAGAAEVDPALHGQSFRALLENTSRPKPRFIYGSHTFHEVQMYYPSRMVRDQRYKLIRNLAWRLPFPLALDLRQSSTWRSFLDSGEGAYGGRTVEAFFDRPEFEFYDLVEDPGELNNLAGDPDQKVRIETFKTELDRFMRETNDPWIAVVEGQQ